MKIESPAAWAKRIFERWGRRKRVEPGLQTKILARAAYVLAVAVVIALWFRLNGWLL